MRVVPSYIHSDNGAVSNVELKSFDATSNMHLTLALFIACGIEGIKHEMSLPEPTNTVLDIFDEERKKQGEMNHSL